MLHARATPLAHFCSPEAELTMDTALHPACHRAKWSASDRCRLVSVPRHLEFALREGGELASFTASICVKPADC